MNDGEELLAADRYRLIISFYTHPWAKFIRESLARQKQTFIRRGVGGQEGGNGPETPLAKMGYKNYN
ncbi:MAG: hypothetical protein LUQ15_07705 [Methanothrix sp.]|nr:hypothetical protein [Methanothrix sp.]